MLSNLQLLLSSLFDFNKLFNKNQKRPFFGAFDHNSPPEGSIDHSGRERS
jgi:hypothetical protein